MKINVLILALVIAIPAFLAGMMQQKPPGTVQAMDIPVFSFTDRAGTVQSSAKFKDKIVMVNFWASWCAPCIVEFPHLLKLAADNRNDVILIALSSDTDVATMARFLKKHDFKTTSNVLIGHDPEGTITRDLFNTYKLPETFIFKDGALIHKMTGANWTPANIQKILD